MVGGALEVSREIAPYLLVSGLEGVCVVNGTKSEAHMREDFDGVNNWKRWIDENENNQRRWKEYMRSFRGMVD